MNEKQQGDKAGEEASARELLEELGRLHTVHLADEMIGRLLEFGALKLGLSDETRAIRDLDDARLAVELLRGVADVLERERGEAVVRPLRAGLAQMQLDYARAVRADAEEKLSAAAGDAPAGEETETGAE